MPYEIKHKSRDVCLIKYVRVKKPYPNFWFDIFILAIALITFIGNLHFLITLAFFIFLLLKTTILFRAKKADLQLPSAFEIRLDRFTNKVSVRNSEQKHKKPIIYALSSFKGFELRKTTWAQKSKPSESKHQAHAELFLKIEHVRGLIRTIPLRKAKYYVSFDNAADIVEAVDKWLRQEDDTVKFVPVKTEPVQGLDDEAQEQAIIRDFKELD